ncbi:DEAD/DEAH box helicase [Bradyrhizobium neotropicale]|uniref:DEAD/DEAH box helicase n=1 Tax=Bradyrhizobium neotropicale TaxID=1497615 RepID=UPI001AD72A98|nr:DEAD/DEAH box helicase [Bradyrhizobium neotropicale]MBO4228046.1 hypothetical protein [Bradyrhizobium neotropicale]
MQLFPYQIEGAAFLARVKRGLLADEMGLGKSAQAIAATALVHGAPVVAVVCPASLRQNWFREFERFWPGLISYSLEVHSYDMVARGALDDWRGDVLILDEAHYLKNHKAKRTKAIFGPKCDGDAGLVSRANHVFCLTGTPTPNNPSELWPMLRAVMPDSIRRPLKVEAAPGKVDGTALRSGAVIDNKGKPLAYWPFVERFCVTQDTGFGIKIVRGKNLPELKERIAPFILRRKKDEVLKDLPPIRFDTLALDGKMVLTTEASEELAKAYAALEADGVEGLKAIAPHVAKLRRITGLAKVEAATDWIAEQLEGGLEKLVVFAHHKDVLSAFARHFEGDYAMVAGDTKPESRQEAVDRFQNLPRCKLFLGQIQAAGTGLTLTAASDVLFVESSWTPSDNQQAAMRVHRIGQRNACLVRFAMLAGSIDEDIQRAVLRKTTDIAKLFS